MRRPHVSLISSQRQPSAAAAAAPLNGAKAARDNVSTAQICQVGTVLSVKRILINLFENVLYWSNRYELTCLNVNGKYKLMRYELSKKRLTVSIS